MQQEMFGKDSFFGSVTVGDRGQVVIPAGARKRFGIEPGEKLLFFNYPAGHGLLMVSVDRFAAMVEHLQRITEAVARGDEAKEEPEAG